MIKVTNGRKNAFETASRESAMAGKHGSRQSEQDGEQVYVQLHVKCARTHAHTHTGVSRKWEKARLYKFSKPALS